MLHGAVTLTVLICLSVFPDIDAFTTSAIFNKTKHDKKEFNFTKNAREIVTSKQDVMKNFGTELKHLYNVDENIYVSESYSQTKWFDVSNASESSTESTGYTDTVFKKNMLKVTDNPLNNNTKRPNATSQNNNEFFTTVTEALTTRHKVDTLIPDDVPNKSIQDIRYHIKNGDNQAQIFILEREKSQLQHHLQLVPMEDNPLGSMMFKNQRYLVSVLVPIGVGMIGAAMIVCTVLTLRKIARKRAFSTPFDNDAETSRSNTPCVSSISTEATDKMFLLLGDDEI